MIISTDIAKLFNEHINTPAFLLDGSGNILQMNSPGKNLLPSSKKNGLIYEAMSGAESTLIKHMLREAKNFGETVSENILLESKSAPNEFDLKITPNFQEDKEYYVVTFNEVEKENKNELNKFYFLTSEIEDILEDKHLLNVIEELKNAYPFTLVGKSQFQKKIDKLKEFFWIKDVDGNYEVVNFNFADSLGTKPNHLQGNREKDFLPKFLSVLFASVDSYIIKTTNAIIVDGVSGESKDENSQVIEFPICNIDNKVVAIVGFSKEKASEKIVQTSKTKLFKFVADGSSSPIAVLDEKGNFVFANKKFLKLFKLAENSNIENFAPEDIFDSELYEKADSFLKIDSKKTDTKEHTFNQNYVYDVFFRKAFNNENEITGISLTFNKKLNVNQSQTEMKVSMYNEIMQNSPEPIFIYDIENLKFLDVNAAALRLYGYNRDEFLQMDLTDLYAPEDIQTLLQSPQAKISDGRFTGPWKHKRKDGTDVMVKISKSLIEYQSHKAHLNIIKDISQEIEQKKEYQKLKLAYENSDDLIFETDKDGFITSANEQVTKELGYSQEELDNKPLISLAEDDKRAELNKKIFHNESKDKSKLYLGIKDSEGNLIQTTLIATPILDYQGEIESYTILGITEKETEKEIVKEVPVPQPASEQQQQDSGGGLDATFLSNLFHEILTPINVIIGFAQELSESIENPNEEQKESAQIINENQKELIQIMDTAAEYSYIVQNKYQVSIEEIRFVDVIEKLFEYVKKEAETNQKELTYGRISSSLQLETDKQKFLTLLTLFVKMVLRVAQEQKLYVTASQLDNNNCVIGVKDSRSSVTQKLTDDLNSIFNEDEDMVRHNYGLSRLTIRLTRLLLEILSVDYRVIKNSKGTAKEFGLVFPLKFEREGMEVTEGTKETPKEEPKEKPQEVEAEQKAPEQEREQTEEQPEKPEPKPQPQPQPKEPEQAKQKEEPAPKSPEPQPEVTPSNGSAKVSAAEQQKTQPIPPSNEEQQKPEPPAQQKPEETQAQEQAPADVSQIDCLYLEDQIDSQILLKAQLKDLNSLEFAASFEEAQPKLKSKQFNLIIMDINLKGSYNGLDVLKMVRKMPGYQNVPIIAVTAYSMPGDKENFCNAGFSGYISKPLSRAKILEAVESVTQA